MDIVDQDYIKKSKINYIRCTQGQLHDGEIMNFVCVQNTCTKKGLICPVCRMAYHQQHKILPLKIFLTEVKNKFMRQTNEQELTGLSDYLRTLENTKKQLLSTLKASVLQIAEKVKQIEEKILQNYNNLRKIILAQSTISTQLPGLINIMIQNGQRDPKQLQAEFNKYAELLRYQDNKLKFFDSSHKLVQDYANLPILVSSHLSKMIPQFIKIFSTIPLNISQNQPLQISKINYTFSDINKIYLIKLSEDFKTAYIDPDDGHQNGGFVLVKQSLGTQNQSITIQIKGNNSGCLILGLGNVDILQSKGYKFDQNDNKHGLYGITSMATTLRNNESYKQQNDFTFDIGDLIQIQWIVKSKVLSFKQRNREEKYVMNINVPQSEIAKLHFAVGLFAQEDQIIILE